MLPLVGAMVNPSGVPVSGKVMGAGSSGIWVLLRFGFPSSVGEQRYLPVRTASVSSTAAFAPMCGHSGFKTGTILSG